MKGKSGYDRSIHEKLDSANWTEMMPGLIKYARAKEGVLINNGSELNYSDLIQEAIARVYGRGEDGKYRNWDAERYPNLAQFLKFVMSEISRRELARITRYPEEQLCWETDSGEERTLPVNNHDRVKAHRSLSPEDLLLREEEMENFADKVDQIYNEDEELGLLIMCIDDGCKKRSQISEETGFPIEKVYNLIRKLKRRLNWNKETILDKQLFRKVKI